MHQQKREAATPHLTISTIPIRNTYNNPANCVPVPEFSTYYTPQLLYHGIITGSFRLLYHGIIIWIELP